MLHEKSSLQGCVPRAATSDAKRKGGSKLLLGIVTVRVVPDISRANRYFPSLVISENAQDAARTACCKCGGKTGTV